MQKNTDNGTANLPDRDPADVHPEVGTADRRRLSPTRERTVENGRNLSAAAKIDHQRR
jgi:hypothetical protein